MFLQCNRIKFIMLLFLVFLIGCGGDTDSLNDTPLSDEVINESPPNLELEILTYDDRGTLLITPNINSSEDLKAYKNQKLAEIEKILDETAEESSEKPYYPVVITMNKPVSLAEMRQMLGKHNPSVAKVLKSSGPINYLPKADLVKNEDSLIINSVKFVSTEGGGQLSYDTLTQESEISKLEKQIAIKEKELNGIDDYQLVKGIVSVQGGIHRNDIMPMQNDPNVFLADIGPAEMYETKPEAVLWDDIYEEVEKYSE